ncbi:hypothetical protein KIM372_15900 [Bombiscardovia nodaiensis]|uniref:Uncharacterized protein n=1 Tax=Bombiscardovia nodaiensis TaxID=2932181 RepID=A0ABN6SDV0_9BIFI|nr:hypothetical protein KIM372_15900 [Bombiscardovia nodaiensis]
MERDELLEGLTTASSILSRIEQAEQRMVQDQIRIAAVQKQASKGFASWVVRHPIIWGIISALVTIALAEDTCSLIGIRTSDFFGEILTLIIVVGGTCLSCTTLRGLAKKSSERKMQKTAPECTALQQDIAQHSEYEQDLAAVFSRQISPWYPADYLTSEAANFFANAVSNGRADTVKEMVNLYEVTLHQQRMENLQQQQLNAQRMGNIINAVGHMNTANAVDRNTQAVREGNSRLGTISGQIGSVSGQLSGISGQLSGINRRLH